MDPLSVSDNAVCAPPPAAAPPAAGWKAGAALLPPERHSPLLQPHQNSGISASLPGVCPWNVKFARAVTEPALALRDQILDVTLDEWAAMDEAEWKRSTQGTALRRAKWPAFQRNAISALRLASPSD